MVNEDMGTWLMHHRARVAGKSPLAEPLHLHRQILDGLCIFLADGRIDIDNNTVEQTIRPTALNRENALSGEHDAGLRIGRLSPHISKRVAQCCRSVRLPVRHTNRHRQRPQAEPDQRADAVELFAAGKWRKSAVGPLRT